MKEYIIQDFETKSSMLVLSEMDLPRIGERITIEQEKTVKGRVIDIHYIYKGHKCSDVEIVIDLQIETDEK